MPASQPRRAFVFGAGGVLGFAWLVGALTALKRECQVEVGSDDLVMGTSAGAVMSALFGCGLSVDTIRRHQFGIALPGDPPIAWNYEHDSGGSLPPRPEWRLGSPGLVWGRIRRPHEVSSLVALSGMLPRGRGDLGAVHSMVDAVAQAELGGLAWPNQRVWIVATDYHTGKRVAFGSPGAPAATLADAVQASCAIPAWYAPVQVGDALYIDGGTVSSTSLDLVRGADFDEVFVLAPMAAVGLDNPHSPVAMIDRRVRMAITRGVTREVDRLTAEGTTVRMFAPGARDLSAMGVNLMNPRRRLLVLHTALQSTTALLRHGVADFAGDSSDGREQAAL